MADPAAMLSQVCVPRKTIAIASYLSPLIDSGQRASMHNATAVSRHHPAALSMPFVIFVSFICDIPTPFILSCIQSHFSLFANADTLSCAHAVFGPRSSRRQCFCLFDQQDRIVLRAVRSPPSPPPSSLLSASSCIVSTSFFEHCTSLVKSILQRHRRRGAAVEDSTGGHT